MNIIQSALQQYQRIVQRLSESLGAEKTTANRDSAIKRFELCFDLAWKLIKIFLQEEKGIACNSPKDCFRVAFRRGLIDYEKEWLRMTDQRNAAVHTYNEELADALYKELPGFLKLFQELQKSIENY